MQPVVFAWLLNRHTEEIMGGIEDVEGRMQTLEAEVVKANNKTDLLIAAFDALKAIVAGNATAEAKLAAIAGRLDAVTASLAGEEAKVDADLPPPTP
jgi:hypothetical protein